MGRLLIVDARGMTTDAVRVAADPDCPLCGDDPAIETVEDVTYEGRCTSATR